VLLKYTHKDTNYSAILRYNAVFVYARRKSCIYASMEAYEFILLDFCKGEKLFLENPSTHPASGSWEMMKLFTNPKSY
jgi:hypothetical protein